MRKRFVALAGGILSLACAVVPATVSAQGQPLWADTGIPKYQHIFEIVMENHNDDQIIGNPNAPVINSLAQTYGQATNYYGITHPSEPNYVAMIGGSYYGIQDDSAYNSTANGVNHTIDAPSLADQLEDAGLSWKDYQQSLPYAGYTGTRYPLTGPSLYASKHNPFMNFASTQTDPAELQKNVPDTQLFADLQSGDVPNFSFIVPDQCHDMHGTTGCTDETQLIQAGDAYVANAVQAIQSSSAWKQGNNAIVVTFDENDFNDSGVTGCCDANPGGGQITTIVITNHGARGVQDSTPYNHYSLLQTIEDAFRLDGCLQNTCDTANVTPMTPLFANGHQGQND